MMVGGEQASLKPKIYAGYLINLIYFEIVSRNKTTKVKCFQLYLNSDEEVNQMYSNIRLPGTIIVECNKCKINKSETQ